MQANPDDTELTAPEVADALDCHISVVYRLDHVLRPRVEMAGRYRRRFYSVAVVDAFLAARAERDAHEVNFRRDWGDE